MLRKVLIAVAVLVLLFLGVVASRPSTYAVERSAVVAAPAPVVFAQVVDFGRWDAWSPWAKLDPNMQTTLTGARGAVGSVYAWTGNSDVGKGRMTVREARPPEHVAIDLEFLEPFASRSGTVFSFAPEGAGTRVTWTMQGTLGFVEKGVGLFMDMDAMIGRDFEKGLAQLKGVAEAEAARLDAEARERAAAQAAAEAAEAAAPAPVPEPAARPANLRRE